MKKIIIGLFCLIVFASVLILVAGTLTYFFGTQWAIAIFHIPFIIWGIYTIGNYVSYLNKSKNIKK